MVPNWLVSRFQNTLYVTIKSDWISVRFVEQNRTLEDRPLVALRTDRKGNRTVVAVGARALSAHTQGNGSVTVHNGFDHPRSCVSDFEIAEAALRYFIAQTLNRSVLVRPIVIMHPLEKIDGGLTQIEIRALSELAKAAGARKTYVWTGRLLELHELATLKFPQTGGNLGWG